MGDELSAKLAVYRDELLNLFNRSSLSLKRRLIFDIELFNNLIDFLDEDSFIYVDFYAQEKFIPTVLSDIKYLEQIADKVIAIFKEVDFYYYERDSYRKIPLKDREEIIRDFLSRVFPKGDEIYRNLISRRQIICRNTDDYIGGAAFPILGIATNFLLLNSLKTDNLATIEFLIHELMHIYDCTFLRNYPYVAYHNLIDGYYLETTELLIEELLYDFFMANHIFLDDILLRYNKEDYETLKWFKTIKYFSEMIKRGELRLHFDGNIFSFLGHNNDLQTDYDNILFRYSIDSCVGDMRDFRCGISKLKSMQLLRGNGLVDYTQIINNFLISLQDSSSSLNLTSANYDEFKARLEQRMCLLKSRYPTPGYTCK